MKFEGRIWTRKLAQEIDKGSVDHYGISALTLMEQAGLACTRICLDLCETWRPDIILCVAGPGNNGGDALVVARHLHRGGLPVTVLSVGHEEHALSSACAHQLQQLPQQLPVKAYSIAATQHYADQRVLVIDGLLGLGVKGDLRPGTFQQALECLNALPHKKVIAIDLPSGLDADGWAKKPLLPADVTVTFGSMKPCHTISPGRDYCGKVYCADIGFAEQAVGDQVSSAEHPQLRMSARFNDSPFDRLPSSAHKFERGHVLIVGGSKGKTGAAMLSALASLRTGAGWASVAVAQDAIQDVGHLPLSLTYEAFLAADGLRVDPFAAFIKERNVRSILFGPGTTSQLLTDAVLEVLCDWQQSTRGGLVIDAGCCTGLLPLIKDNPLLRERTLVTPHPGEWRRLGGGLPDSLDHTDDLAKLATSDSAALATLVYKSASPIIWTAENEFVVSDAGDASLGKAGSGDLVAGCAAAFLTQDVSASEAFLRAQQYVGDAARHLKKSRSEHAIISTDLLDALGRLQKKE